LFAQQVVGAKCDGSGYKAEPQQVRLIGVYCNAANVRRLAAYGSLRVQPTLSATKGAWFTSAMN
jgi:hypothetical protein